MVADSVDRPIFILGILPRSGTNLLFNLLRLHSDCGITDPIWEDYTVQPSPLLIEYAEAVFQQWKAAGWGLGPAYRDEFCKHLGYGMLSFLHSQNGGQRVLTKTPHVTNVRNFFMFYPDAFLLILVRDGRDLTESAVRSFDWDRDWTTRQWAAGAKTILEFDQANRDKGLRYRIVRYEDLCLDLDGQLPELLRFLELDEEGYDFAAAHNLPVYGSSETREQAERVHWRPTEKSSKFKSVGRSLGWDRRKHERFNWLAGEYLAQFGYEPQRYEDRRRVWALYNRIVDVTQRLGLQRLVPKWVWRLIREGSYRLLRLGGAEL